MERIRLDENALEIQLPKQLLEHRTLVVVTCGVAGLSDRYSQGCGVQRHLGDERRTAAASWLNGAPEAGLPKSVIKPCSAVWSPPLPVPASP